MQATQSCPTLCDSMGCPWNSPGQNTGVGSLSLHFGNFPIQGSNLGLLHCRQILYRLSHQGSPKILEWIAYPFYSESSRPRNITGVSCTAGGFFTSWATRETLILPNRNLKKNKWVNVGHKLVTVLRYKYSKCFNTRHHNLWPKNRSLDSHFLIPSSLFSFSFFKLFIYLAIPCISWRTWDLESSLQHVESF